MAGCFFVLCLVCSSVAYTLSASCPSDHLSECTVDGYRDGRCDQCDCCPLCWQCVELHSKHYRCAERLSIPTTTQVVNLGELVVGTSVSLEANNITFVTKAGSEQGPSGFLQCPTLPRLPQGLEFSDDGSLHGIVEFDPFRAESYAVNFVAISAAEWANVSVGIVRLEINAIVTGNKPSSGQGHTHASQVKQQAQVAAREAQRLIEVGFGAYDRYSKRELSHEQAVSEMLARLRELRDHLEDNPRLEGGKWWGYLGALHMNVHKLMENTLFECELYLGHALLFAEAGHENVREEVAEGNLQGCYAKRQLEAAKFMWLRGLDQMLGGSASWDDAALTLEAASHKKDGWGWGVNNGDIWIAIAAVRLNQAAALGVSPRVSIDVQRLLAAARDANERATARTAQHPWAMFNAQALTEIESGHAQDGEWNIRDWAENFKQKSYEWVAISRQQAAPKDRVNSVEYLLARMSAVRTSSGGNMYKSPHFEL